MCIPINNPKYLTAPVRFTDEIKKTAEQSEQFPLLWTTLPFLDFLQVMLPTENYSDYSVAIFFQPQPIAFNPFPKRNSSE